MKLGVMDLRKIIQDFLKEEFGVEKFRINSAIPNETSKIWLLVVSYNIQITQTAELGDLKLEPKMTLAKSCLVAVDDEKGQVYSWNEF